MATYRVEWSMIYEADNPEDAAKQAWATLDDATSHNEGATILFVSDEYGYDEDHGERFNMEEVFIERALNGRGSNKRKETIHGDPS